MAGILEIIIILVCAGLHFQKSTIVKSFGLLFSILFAAMVAFNFFETLAQLIISRAGDMNFLVSWAPALSFLLLAVITFSALQALMPLLTRQPVDLSPLAEKIGRPVLGAVFGYFAAGIVLTTLAIAPLPLKYPYERFDQNNPNIEKPNKSLLNSDGFITSLVSRISDGSFATITNTKSFAAIHPDFLNQLYLNRLAASDSIPIISNSNELAPGPQNGAWLASQDLKDTSNKLVEAKTGSSLIITRIGIKKPVVFQSNDAFKISQLRLVCKPKSKTGISGRGKNVYPIGYLVSSRQMQRIKITDKIELGWDDLSEQLPGGQGKNIDFVFEVPNTFTPFAVEFRQNSIAAAPDIVSADKAPVANPFLPSSKCAKEYVEVEPISNAKIYAVELTSQSRLLENLRLDVKNKEEWQNLQTKDANDTIEPAHFEGGKIDYVRAALKVTTPPVKEQDQSSKKTNSLAALLKPIENYRLIAAKCNEPNETAQISGEQLPALIDINGREHKPVGVIAAGSVGENTIYEVDFCSLTADKKQDGLVIADDGTVTKPFPSSIWITEKGEKITEFYILYMVKVGSNTIITYVKSPDSPVAAGLKNYKGFSTK